MVVVSDSSAIWVLVNLGLTGLLPTLYEHVVMPSVIKAELADPKRPTAVRAFVATAPPWLEERAPKVIERIPGLHPGEEAAIALAEEIRPDRILLDEERARKAATEKGLRVIGVVGVLIAAAERKLIDLEQTFDELKKTDFWISHKLLDKELARFQERERQREQGQEQVAEK